jgi:galactonate dehydratase
MKIENVQTYLVEAGHRNWLFTKILTDEGITGISETTIKRKERTLKASVEELIRFLIGKDPTCIEDHVEKMYRDAFWVGGAMLVSAISAVEAAMWDILGKSVGLPIYKIMGGPTRERIRVYRWIGAGRDAPPDAWIDAALEAKEQGFTAVKIGALGMTSLYGSEKETEGLSPGAIKAIVKRLASIREAVGWEFDIAIDLGGRLNSANAIRLISNLEELDLMFVEEPLPPENVDALVRVANAVRTPLATGERLHTKYAYRELLEKNAVAILQPDVCNVGGILESKKVAAMAEAYYVPIAPHNPNGPVATAMTAHVAASIPNFLIMETVGSLEPERTRHEEIVLEPLEIKDGYLELPLRPGLGVELNEDAISHHPFVISDARRL